MDPKVSRILEQFFGQYPTRHYKKGQILIYGGDNPNSIYNIVSGIVRQYSITNSGEVAVVNRFKLQAFFPMSWAIGNIPNTYFYETLTAADIRVAPVDDVLKMLHDNPVVTYDLLRRTYSGIEGILTRATISMYAGAKSRVLLELITSCKRFGKHVNQGYRIDMTGIEIAECSGLTRETVSRELHKLQVRGLLTVRYGGVTVNNFSKLIDEYESSL